MRVLFPFVSFLMVLIALTHGFLTKLISKTIFLTLGILLFGIVTVLVYLMWSITHKRWETKRYIFDGKNVHIIAGVIGTSHETYALSGITSIKITQSAIDRICDCGTITLNFFGGSKAELTNIPNPSLKLLDIQKYVEFAKS